MANPFPVVRPPLHLGPGIRDRAVSTAIRALETWADDIAGLLSRLDLTPGEGVLAGTVSSVTAGANMVVTPTTGDVVVALAATISVSQVTVTSMTPGSVLFAGAGGLISQDNAAFFWNNTSKSLLVGGAFTGTGNCTFGTNESNRHTGNGGIDIYETVGASLTGMDTIPTPANLGLWDSTAQTTGVGGGIMFLGKYDNAGNYAGAAGIKAMKVNSTSTHYSFDLVFGTRLTGSGSIAECARFMSTGDASFLFNLSCNGNATLGNASTDSHTANGILNVQNLRGKVQTVTTTGVATVTINDDTTVLRLNPASLLEIIGFTGGADGRVILVENIGAANTLVYHENAGASATNRIRIDGSSSQALYNNGVPGGMGLLWYDGTSSRWKFSTLWGSNSPASVTVNGSLGVTSSANVAGNVTAGTNSASTHTLNGNLTLSNAPAAGSLKVGSANARVFLGRQIFTASGTYTPTAGTKAVLVKAVGGGGGGAGAGGTTVSMGVGGGGWSGTYLEKWIDAAASITGGAVTIGAAGAAGASGANNGGDGGDTSVVIQGTTYTAKGGAKGLTNTPTTATSDTGISAYLTGSTAGDFNVAGPPGRGMTVGTSAFMSPGWGGSSPLGGGGYSTNNTAGSVGTGYGAGGGGGSNFLTANRAGGAGTAGCVIIEEYA